MKTGQNSLSYSSSIGKNTLHMGFKVKYCHPIFDDEQVEKRCAEIFHQVSERKGIVLHEIGFDRDHVHIDVDGGPNYAPKDIAKLFKGTSGRKLLKEFPYLKKKYFWGSGLWSSSYYFDSMGDRTKEEIDEYIKNQGNKVPKIIGGQQSLQSFLST
ncbi:MAG: IS200/IS605 family transposase [Thermoplasmata archaeon]